MNDGPQRTDWPALELEKAFQSVQSSEQGLTQEEAGRRLERFGRNALPQESPPAWWEILLRQFKSPLIYLLLAAAVVSLIAGDVQDAAFIAAVLAINAFIGSYQEWRAERNTRALQQLLKIRASAVRDGDVRELDAEEIVPGDVVWLEAGNRVPADLRLIAAQGLQVDESLLTGESVAVTKDARWKGEPKTAPSEALNMAFAGSIVARGKGRGVVVTTGVSTEVGHLAQDVLSAVEGKPPLLKRMERFARTIAYAVLGSVAVVSVMGVLLHGYSIHEMFLFGVALAVSAIPEGLPAAVTVALAIATTRMARRNVIVRRLATVEGLGSCTMIASDKTGTLTCNELTVRRIQLPDGRRLEVEGEGFEPEGELLLEGEPVQADSDEEFLHLLRIGVLCNEAELKRRDGEWTWRGDPTDVALLTLGEKGGLSRKGLLEDHPQGGELPFESERQFAATFHRFDEGVKVFVKGAPERVLSMCEWSGDEDRHRDLRDMAERLAREGYRVLGLADGPAPDDLGSDDEPPEPAGLEFRGFVAMIDPLRPGVREAVETCHKAGIKVCMVTGDHPVTALAIARDLGLSDDPEQVVSGKDLNGKDAEGLRELIGRGRVFARVSPHQKLQLVEAAQKAGHFVAVTGDGANDAPALRAANIGVAMGKAGTDIAREASELVISDDNFATIVAGVEEGRIAYDNVRKVIYLLVSTGAAEVLLIAAAFAAGPMLPLPLTPVQLLWLNLVTNGIQGVALAFEPGEKGILTRKPRLPSEPIFNRLMIERTLVAAVVMAAVGVATFWWMISNRWEHGSAQNVLLLLLVLFENIHIANCRSETRSAFVLPPFRSPFLMIGVICAFGVHVLAMHLPPLQPVLGTEPVSLASWGILFGLALTVLVAIELHKWTWQLRHRGA